MKTAILIYLLIGLVFGFLVEIVWPTIDEEPLTMGHRVLLVVAWPVVLLLALYNLIIGDDDDGPTLSGGH